MFKRAGGLIIALFLSCFLCGSAYCQQDVDLTLRFFAEENVLKTEGDRSNWSASGTVIQQAAKFNFKSDTKTGKPGFVNLPTAVITGDQTSYCLGGVATLSENVPADASYTINWYVNNTLLAADKNNVQIHTTVSGIYQVRVVPNNGSATTYSDGYVLTFIPPPDFKLDYPPALQFCAGTTAVLQTTANESYLYQWFKDGQPLADADASKFDTTLPGTYTVQVSSCPGTWVPAPNSVKITFVETPVPVITTDKSAYCIGDNAKLSISNITDPTYNVNWYKDNVQIPEDNGLFSINTTISGTYYAIVISNFVDANGVTCSQQSQLFPLTFGEPQTISVAQSTPNGLCPGQPVLLKAIYKASAGTPLWSTGETTDQISVTHGGTYSVKLITPTGSCEPIGTSTVTYLPDPVLPPISDVPLCVYKKQTAIITAPPGFVQYSWNDQAGAQTYSVSQLGTVKLTVTDANGCAASENINVVQQCPEVDIPNTFTPNGDNINDTWVIQGLDNAAKVTIFNRNGTQIFKSVGYGVPWDGSYKGKKLPSGAYYYIINTKSGVGKYSGVVMVVY